MGAVILDRLRVGRKEEKYMKGLKDRLAKIEAAINPPGIDWGWAWELQRQMDIATCAPAPGTSEEEHEAQVIERIGTKENFIREGEESDRARNPRRFKRTE
jgi:hypothetical protein